MNSSSSPRSFPPTDLADPALASADARLTRLRAWLAATGAAADLDPATLTLASSDAGFRRYFRITRRTGSGSLIVMDAPPPEKSREFVRVQALLREAGVHVPDIFAADVEQGFMLLTDLGRQAYIDILPNANAATARSMMRDALGALLRWQMASRPGVLPQFDSAFVRRELDLLPEWYIERHLGHTMSVDDRATLDSVFDLLTDNILGQPQSFMHRDFMPRNLLLCAPAPAVIDFQDAVMGPMTYDVISLFRDAFISWDEAFELDHIAWFWGQAKAAGLPVRTDFAEYYRELEWTGLQRHLKILGLFARLAYRDHKPSYLADTPRFIGYASKVANRYRELRPLARLLAKLDNQRETVAYTF